jgi:Acetyl-coenzyme A transporter 1
MGSHDVVEVGYWSQFLSLEADGGNYCRKNVGYASTCNVVGQTVGIFFGNVVYLTLQSKEFANKWLRSTPADTGIVDLDGGSLFIFLYLACSDMEGRGNKG